MVADGLAVESRLRITYVNPSVATSVAVAVNHDSTAFMAIVGATSYGFSKVTLCVHACLPAMPRAAMPTDPACISGAWDTESYAMPQTFVIVDASPPLRVRGCPRAPL